MAGEGINNDPNNVGGGDPFGFSNLATEENLNNGVPEAMPSTVDETNKPNGDGLQNAPAEVQGGNYDDGGGEAKDPVNSMPETPGDVIDDIDKNRKRKKLPVEFYVDTGREVDVPHPPYMMRQIDPSGYFGGIMLNGGDGGDGKNEMPPDMDGGENEDNGFGKGEQGASNTVPEGGVAGNENDNYYAKDNKQGEGLAGAANVGDAVSIESDDIKGVSENSGLNPAQGGVVENGGVDSFPKIPKEDLGISEAERNGKVPENIVNNDKELNGEVPENIVNNDKELNGEVSGDFKFDQLSAKDAYRKTKEALNEVDVLTDEEVADISRRAAFEAGTGTKLEDFLKRFGVTTDVGSEGIAKIPTGTAIGVAPDYDGVPKTTTENGALEVPESDNGNMPLKENKVFENNPGNIISSKEENDAFGNVDGDNGVGLPTDNLSNGDLPKGEGDS